MVSMRRSWVLPVVSWVEKVYNVPEAIICQLKSVYHVIPGTTCCELNQPILLRPRLERGRALPSSEVFLMHQAVSPFVSMVREPHILQSKPVQEFYRWAMTMGFTPSPNNLPYIQLGMV